MVFYHTVGSNRWLDCTELWIDVELALGLDSYVGFICGTKKSHHDYICILECFTQEINTAECESR